MRWAQAGADGRGTKRKLRGLFAEVRLASGERRKLVIQGDEMSTAREALAIAHSRKGARSSR